MGPGPRFDICIRPYIGIGIGYEKFPYRYTFTIDLPFVSIFIGLGKSYTDEGYDRR